MLKLVNHPCGFDPGRGATKVAPVFLRGNLRTNIYIDGFNLYYRALKNTKYKWLDLKKLFTLLLNPSHSINKIKYFTTRVSGILDPHQPIRQETYLRAIEAYISELSIYYGKFLSHVVSMPQANFSDPKHPLIKPIKFVPVFRTDEKGSDVNLAVQLVNDAWLDDYDCAVVVSNDSDLQEALKIIKNQQKKKIGICIPGNETRVRPSTIKRTY